jgi:hypothetical protein
MRQERRVDWRELVVVSAPAESTVLLEYAGLAVL